MYAFCVLPYLCVVTIQEQERCKREYDNTRSTSYIYIYIHVWDPHMNKRCWRSNPPSVSFAVKIEIKGKKRWPCADPTATRTRRINRSSISISILSPGHLHSRFAFLLLFFVFFVFVFHAPQLFSFTSHQFEESSASPPSESPFLPCLENSVLDLTTILI